MNLQQLQKFQHVGFEVIVQKLNDYSVSVLKYNSETS